MIVLGVNAYHGDASAFLLRSYVPKLLTNRKAYARSPFRRLYVQSAAGEAGGAIGTAIVDWERLQRWTQGSALGD